MNLSAPTKRKRSHDDSDDHASDGSCDDQAVTKRSRLDSDSESDPDSEEKPGVELPQATRRCPPPTPYDLDRLNYHIDLESFGQSLQNAANAVFSNNKRSRYTQTSALLLSWEDEDPQLPVSVEIEALRDVFANLYGFEVEEWKIPSVNSHMELNLKILNFLKDSNSKHLKIVYYAGHGKLSNHGQAIWSSYRNVNRDRHPTVKWSGIQNALEESASDVLVLLDCCASGMSNTDEGNGVTELLAACAFNNTANGVGEFSFTQALICQLRKLVHMPSFTVGYLYNLLFTEIQGLRVKDVSYRKPPVHLVLTQDHRLPRSITLAAKRPSMPDPLQRSMPPPAYTVTADTNNSNNENNSSVQQSSSFNSPASSLDGISPFSTGAPSSMTSISQLPEYPRLLFSVRINENVKPKDLSADLFADWLATLPMDATSVRVEAGFASDSTLLMVSMPVAFLGYLPDNDAITMLGTTRSRNLLPPPKAESLTEKASSNIPPYAIPPFNDEYYATCDRCVSKKWNCNASATVSCTNCLSANANCQVRWRFEDGQWYAWNPRTGEKGNIPLAGGTQFFGGENRESCFSAWFREEKIVGKDVESDLEHESNFDDK